MKEEPKGYELLKLETLVSRLENELILIFKEYEELRKKAEKEKTTILQDPLYQKQQKLNIVCISLIRAYRDYMKQLKEK